MHTAIKAALTMLAVSIPVSGASAQSASPVLGPSTGDTQIVAAVTLPLGHSSERGAAAPRFEIISRSRAPHGVLAVLARDEERRWHERRIGFTLDGSDHIMINGRALQSNDGEDRDGVSTLGAIGIGVGVLLAVTIVTVADGVDAIEDLSDPD